LDGSIGFEYEKHCGFGSNEGMGQLRTTEPVHERKVIIIKLQWSDTRV
jgi:hypothetical protein